MTLSSAELANRCLQRGILSKEAYDRIMIVRSRLIKKALAKEAASALGGIARGAGKKSEGFFSALKKNLGFAGMSGPTSKVDAAGKVIKDAVKDPTSWGAATSNIAKMVALGGALAAGGGAVSGLMRHSRDKKIRRDIENSYEKMFAETPGLGDMDKDKVRRHFGVLANYAPSLAADPTVAGAWVKGTVQMGHIDTNSIERLGATQSMIDRHHEGRSLFQPGHFTAGVGLARAALGGGGGGSGGQ